MAVKSFRTNNLVAEYDMYQKFMKHRWSEITENGDKNTERLFYKDGLLGCVTNGESVGTQTNFNTYATICKWHCIVLSYEIWYKIVNDRAIDGGPTSYKKFVDVPESALKKFKYDFSDAVKKAECDYNKRINRTNGSYDACRYLAMFWTLLDCKKDERTQRFFPTQNTIARAAKVFGYSEDENPFIMNGKYWHYNKVEEEKEPIVKDSKEETPVESKQETVKNGDDLLTTDLEEFDLSARTLHALLRNNVHVFGDLLKYTRNQLKRFRNFGLISLKEVTEVLENNGYEYFPEFDVDARPRSKTLAIIEKAAEHKFGPVHNPSDETYKEIAETSNNQALKQENEELKKLVDQLKDQIDHLKEEGSRANSTLNGFIGEVYRKNDQIAELKDELKKRNEVRGTSTGTPFDILNSLIGSLKKNKIDCLGIVIDGYVIDINPKKVIEDARKEPLIRTTHSYDIRSREAD